MRTLKEVDAKVELIEIDLWKGKDQDNPSVVTRLLVLERDMNDLKATRNENRMWFLGIIGTVIASLILMHLKIF
jgi:hypothetical protein